MLFSSLGIFGEKVGLALQKVHEKNGAKFYPETQITELTVRIVEFLFSMIPTNISF